jgi:hypothetical protein
MKGYKMGQSGVDKCVECEGKDREIFALKTGLCMIKMELDDTVEKLMSIVIDAGPRVINEVLNFGVFVMVVVDDFDEPNRTEEGYKLWRGWAKKRDEKLGVWVLNTPAATRPLTDEEKAEIDADTCGRG